MHMSGNHSADAKVGINCTGTGGRQIGMPAAQQEVVRAQQQHVPAAVLATDSALAEPVDAGARRDRSQPALTLPGIVAPERPEPRALARVVSLVEEVIACLDAPSLDQPLRATVAQCNAELESCLEAERERARDGAAPSAQDELRRLARQLVSDRADTTVIMRRIRRVLGRVDAHAR